MSAPVALRTEGLSKTYHPGEGGPVRALADVSLSVRPGEVFGLLGPNGAGKTTLVRILATLLQASAGVAEVCGHDVVREEQTVRCLIGYAGQDSEHSAYYRLTVRENLLYFAHALRRVPRVTACERIAGIAEAIGFTGQLDKEFTTLSGGQKQLVVVMRALLHHPAVVFLDEPSKSLDPVTAERVRAFLLDHAREQGTTVLLTTHNMREAEEVCDRLAFIDRGRLQFVGTPAGFRRAVTVQEVVEIGIPARHAIVQRLRRLRGVSRVTANDAVRLYCDDGFSVMGKVMSLLETEGTKARVAMVEPSLEDAFSIFVATGEEGSSDRHG